MKVNRAASVTFDANVSEAMALILEIEEIPETSQQAMEIIQLVRDISRLIIAGDSEEFTIVFRINRD